MVNLHLQLLKVAFHIFLIRIFHEGRKYREIVDFGLREKAKLAAIINVYFVK
jgi:hypothetical protein